MTPISWCIWSLKVWAPSMKTWDLLWDLKYTNRAWFGLFGAIGQGLGCLEPVWSTYIYIYLDPGVPPFLGPTCVLDPNAGRLHKTKVAWKSDILGTLIISMLSNNMGQISGAQTIPYSSPI